MINGMKKRIIICLIVCILMFTFTVSAQESVKIIYDGTAVMDYAVNNDNSLVVMNICQEIDWSSAICVFQPGMSNGRWTIKKLWNKNPCPGTISNLAYSSISDNFYFSVSYVGSSEYADTTGLYIIRGNRTDTFATPIIEQHWLSEGAGYIQPNKAGVWYLRDTPSNSARYYWNNSTLYQIEDMDGRFLIDVPKAADDMKTISFWRMNNIPEEADSAWDNIKDMVFQTTDYSLLLRDQDTVSWWNFDCVKQTAIKYASLDEARAAGIALDAKYSRNAYWKEHHITLYVVLASVALALIAALIVQIILSRKRTVKPEENSVKERNRMTFEIQEKERAKISRDIHDSVVQDIRVIRLETENLVVDEASKERQSKIEDIATDCIVKLRNICYNLTPAELTIQSRNGSSEFELISIINSLVQQFSSRTHFPCVFKVAEGFEYPVLDKEATQNLFRVIQEALTNIEKHSYATQASIFIKEEDGVLQIYITDDGIGCNPDELKKKIAKKEHLGLRSMMDRMELIGGTIEFFTAQDDGMEIKITLPLEKTGE